MKGKISHTSLSSLFFLLLTSNLLGQCQQSQNFSWLRSGIYAEYTSTRVPEGRIIFPNGTKLRYEVLNFPSTLRWEIVKVTDKTVLLNLTFSIKGDATVVNPDDTISSANVAYRKILSVEVDIETREASIDREPIGKASFWSEANATIGQQIQISSFPSDLLVGDVIGFKTISLIGRLIASYEVEVFQLNPFVVAYYTFDQQTGIALKYTFVGSIEIKPNSTHTYTFPNGTTYEITSYSKTKLSEILGLEGTYDMILAGTNAEFGESLRLTNAYIYVVIFLGLFIALSTVFISVYRKKRQKHISRRIHKATKRLSLTKYAKKGPNFA